MNLSGNESFGIKSTHLITVYVTFQPGTFSKLGRNVSFGIKKYSSHFYICYISARQMCRLELKSIHVIYIYVTFQPGTFSKLGENVSFGIKKYSSHHYICNILARRI